MIKWIFSHISRQLKWELSYFNENLAINHKFLKLENYLIFDPFMEIFDDLTENYMKLIQNNINHNILEILN